MRTRHSSTVARPGRTSVGNTPERHIAGPLPPPTDTRRFSRIKVDSHRDRADDDSHGQPLQPQSEASSHLHAEGSRRDAVLLGPVRHGGGGVHPYPLPATAGDCTDTAAAAATSTDTAANAANTADSAKAIDIDIEPGPHRDQELEKGHAPIVSVDPRETHVAQTSIKKVEVSAGRSLPAARRSSHQLRCRRPVPSRNHGVTLIWPDVPSSTAEHTHPCSERALLPLVMLMLMLSGILRPGGGGDGDGTRGSSRSSTARPSSSGAPATSSLRPREYDIICLLGWLLYYYGAGRRAHDIIFYNAGARLQIGQRLETVILLYKRDSQCPSV